MTRAERIESATLIAIRFVVTRIAKLEQGLDATVDPAPLGVELGKGMDPVATFARRVFVADRERQQRFEFADAQVFPE